MAGLALTSWWRFQARSCTAAVSSAGSTLDFAGISSQILLPSVSWAQLWSRECLVDAAVGPVGASSGP